MKEIYADISKLTFASFCRRIKRNRNGAIDFELKYNFYGNKRAEVYRIQEFDSNLILSDMGNTLANLGDRYEIFDPAVKHNIIKVLSYYDINSLFNSLVYRIEPSRKLIPQIEFFLCGIQSLYAMNLLKH